jgi:hypothetical protein
VCFSGVCGCPSCAGGTPIERAGVGFLSRRCAGGWWSRAPSLFSLLLVAIGLAMLRTLGALDGKLVRTFVGPVAGSATFVTIAGLLVWRSADTRLVLDERHHLSSSDWRTGCNVAKCSWRSLSITNVVSRWPLLLTVVKGTVTAFCLGTDVFVDKFHGLHVFTCCHLLFESNIEQGLLKLLIGRTEWKAEDFVAIASSQ